MYHYELFLAVPKTVHNIITYSKTALRSLSTYFGQSRTSSGLQSIYPARYISAVYGFEGKGTDPIGRSRVQIPPRAWMSVWWVLCVIRWRSPRRAHHSPRGVLARLESLSRPIHKPLIQHNKFSISSFTTENVIIIRGRNVVFY
jgi:hypothetical protein